MHRVEFGSPTLSKQDVVSKSPFLVLKVHRNFHPIPQCIHFLL